METRKLSLTTKTIFLDNVRLYAFHGVQEQERRVGGWFTVSVRVQYDFSRALETDSVSDTLNYADVLQVVKREMALPSQLLEHVAGRIARAIINEFSGVEAAKVTVIKQNPPMGANCDGAGVEVELFTDVTTPSPVDYSQQVYRL